MAIDAAKIGFFDWDCIRNKHMWSGMSMLCGFTPQLHQVLDGGSAGGQRLSRGRA